MTRKQIFREIVRRAWQLSTLWLKTGQHVTRYYMYRHLARYRKDFSEGTRVLSISGSIDLSRQIGARQEQITDARYPEYNMLELSFEDETFDVVVSDQVLEHIEGNPQQAINECFRVLKPGGIALHTTCFINPIHNSPGDFWRFTPAALRTLTRDQADVVESLGWGNRWVWILEFFGLRFVRIPHSVLHPLHWIAVRNNPKWPVVTWVYCLKKTGSADQIV